MERLYDILPALACLGHLRRSLCRRSFSCAPAHCPNGASSQSPTLPPRGYVGSMCERGSNPNGVAAALTRMPQSLSAVYIHLVFSTKDRRPWLRDQAQRQGLHAYIEHQEEH